MTEILKPTILLVKKVKSENKRVTWCLVFRVHTLSLKNIHMETAPESAPGLAVPTTESGSSAGFSGRQRQGTERMLKSSTIWF